MIAPTPGNPYAAMAFEKAMKLATTVQAIQTVRNAPRAVASTSAAMDSGMRVLKVVMMETQTTTTHAPTAVSPPHVAMALCNPARNVIKETPITTPAQVLIAAGTIVV